MQKIQDYNMTWSVFQTVNTWHSPLSSFECPRYSVLLARHNSLFWSNSDNILIDTSTPFLLLRCVASE